MYIGVISMNMNWREAKIWAQKEEGRDWRTMWKYGDIVRGVGRCGNTPCFDWGINATQEQKDALTDIIENAGKWAAKVEAILDDPPTGVEMTLLKKMKKWNGK